MDDGSSPYCNCPDNFVGTFCTVSVPITEGKKPFRSTYCINVPINNSIIIIMLLFKKLMIDGQKTQSLSLLQPFYRFYDEASTARLGCSRHTRETTLDGAAKFRCYRRFSHATVFTLN